MNSKIATSCFEKLGQIASRLRFNSVPDAIRPVEIPLKFSESPKVDTFVHSGTLQQANHVIAQANSTIPKSLEGTQLGESFKKAVDEISGQEVEIAMVFDKNGTLIAKTQPGTNSSCEFSKEDLKKIADTSKTSKTGMIHNHVTGMTFSATDMASFWGNNFSDMMVTMPGGGYAIFRKTKPLVMDFGRGLGFKSDCKKLILEEEIAQMKLARSSADNETFSKALNEFRHKALSDYAKKYADLGLEYEYKPSKSVSGNLPDLKAHCDNDEILAQFFRSNGFPEEQIAEGIKKFDSMTLEEMLANLVVF